MRAIDGYFFEDYAVGQHFNHATPRTITAGDVALYISLTGSRFPLYCAKTTAQALGFGDSPIDDLLLFHIAFGKTVADISYNAVANLGYADVRFLTPVYVGDTIRAESDVIGIKENSNGKTGVLYVRSIAYNQENVEVLTWIRWVMISKRNASNPSPIAILPILPKSVPADLLPNYAHLSPSGLRKEMTGSSRFFNEYEVGEVINHPAGMTIDETDHTLATRLYQNTARVHFDAHHMQSSRFGKRLIYGGQIISVCRALSYDGLENTISIAAINGGSHTNPSFAGDTLYAKSVVLEKITLTEKLGALRIRMLGIKNAEANSVDHTADALPESVVLDLDYTVLIPTVGA